jgi:hypothetical protein
LAVVTLDIMRNETGLVDYRSLPFALRLEKLVKRIHDICAELKVKEPDAKWLVVWREHGIEGYGRCYASTQEKRDFKAAMQALTDEYEQLAIIAGTIRSGKNIRY